MSILVVSSLQLLNDVTYKRKFITSRPSFFLNTIEEKRERKKQQQSRKKIKKQEN